MSNVAWRTKIFCNSYVIPDLDCTNCGERDLYCDLFFGTGMNHLIDTIQCRFFFAGNRPPRERVWAAGTTAKAGSGLGPVLRRLWRAALEQLSPPRLDRAVPSAR